MVSMSLRGAPLEAEVTIPDGRTVRVRIGGTRLATLPGGHLELDEPLSRSSF